MLKEFKFGKDWCKTHVLHYPIKNYHISILLKIQCILPQLITFQYIHNLVYGY